MMASDLPSAPAASLGRTAPAPAKQETTYHRVVIFGDEDNYLDVPFRLNGKELFVRRNQDVILPGPMLEVLREAKAPLTYIGGDGRTYATAPQPRYKYVDKGLVSAEEYHRLLAERRVMSSEPMPQVTEMQRNLQQALAHAAL